MDTVNEMVENLTIKHSDKLRRVCEPLNRYFGINHFFFTKTMSNGQFFSIGSNPSFQEYYYTEKKFIWNPLNVDPKLVKPGLYSYHHLKSTKYHETIDEIKDKTPVRPILAIASKEKDQFIRFGYSTNFSLDVNKQFQLLNKNFELLNLFNRYFLTEMDFLLKDAWSNSISLIKEMGNEYSSPTFNETPFRISLQERLKFLNNMQILKNCEHLTNRELEYLSFIAKGMTSKQIAQFMNRSVRTIENFIETLKSKFGCVGKVDLIRIAQLFE